MKRVSFFLLGLSSILMACGEPTSTSSASGETLVLTDSTTDGISTGIRIGETLTFTWNVTASSVSVQYYDESTSDWVDVVAYYSGSSYEWEVPSSLGSTATFRVLNQSDFQIGDELTVDVRPALGSPSGISLVSPGSSPGTDPTPTVSLSGLTSGYQVDVYLDSTCSTAVVTETSTSDTLQVDIPELAVGTYELYATQTEGADTSACSASLLSYEYEQLVDLALTATGNDSMDITGATSPGSAVTVTVTNNGEETSSDLSGAISLSNTTNFQISANTCTATLATGASCTVDVQPLATGNGSYSGTLDISVDNNPSLDLSGTASGFAADLEITVSSGDADNMDATGGTSPGSAVVFDITNNGTAESSDLTGTVSLSDTTNFQIASNGCTSTLAIGASCQVSVEPIAFDNGAYSGSLDVSADDTATIALSGTSSGFAPDLEFTVQSGDKDTMDLAGGTSPGSNVEFLVSNNGTGISSDLNATFSLTNTTNFEFVTNDCTSTLMPAATCVVTIRPIATYNDAAFTGDLQSSADDTPSITMNGSAAGFPWCNSPSPTDYDELDDGGTYYICNEDQLNDIGASSCQGCADTFIVGADIDMSGITPASVNMIGDATTKFTGSFDGGDFTISGLSLEESGSDNVGLFGYINGATIEDLNLEVVSIEGDNYVGALFGRDDGGSTIEDSNITVGSITASGDYVGGVGGNLAASTTASNLTVVGSASTSSIRGDGQYIGGAYGYIDVGGGNSVSAVTTNQLSIYGDSEVGGAVGQLNSGDLAYALVGIDYAVTVYANDQKAGGVVGNALGDISNSQLNNGLIYGDLQIGGIAGRTQANIDSSSVRNSELRGYLSTGTPGTGGVAGIIDVSAGASISNSYVNTTDINSDYYSNYGDYFGGLIGQILSGAGGTLSNSYSAANVCDGSCNGSNAGSVSGNTGFSTITEIVWDTDTSGFATVGDGETATGSTTSDLTTDGDANNIVEALDSVSWDLASTWEADPAFLNGGYPELVFELTEAQLSLTDVTGNKDSLNISGSSPGTANTFRVTNDGDTESADLAGQIAVDSANQFQIANNTCTGTLAASGGTCTFDVEPIAVVNYTYSGTVKVTANNTPELSLSGTSTGLTEYTSSASADFDRSASPNTYLTFVPGGASSDPQKATFATWFKRETTGSIQHFAYATDSVNEYIGLDASDRIDINFYNPSPQVRFVSTTTVTDSNWNHLVVQLDMAADSKYESIIVYLNGTRIYGAITGTPRDLVGLGQNGKTQHLSIYVAGEDFDGKLAETHFIDGQLVAPDSFIKDGKPVTYTGTYGNNGYYLNYSNSSDLGEDFSGNDNDFTNNNSVAYDGADAP